MRLLYIIQIITCFGLGRVHGLEYKFDLNIPFNDTETHFPGGGISGGNRVLMQAAPWHVGIYTKSSNPYMQICGGTVVAKKVVITAAHCFSQDRHVPPASRYAVAAGKIYRPWNDPHDEGVQKREVKDIKVPQHYQGSAANFQGDIAVVTVDEEFLFNSYVEPACVSFNFDFDRAHLREGQLGKVVGWGLTGENSSPSQVLQSAVLPTVSIDKCIEQSPASFRSSITGDKICAGYNNGTAVCRGDSGGGLVFQATVDYRSTTFLRGVVSTSPATENMCNIHTWATFTHLLSHEHFVKSIAPDVDKFCPDNYFPQFTSRLGQSSEVDTYTCTCPKTYKIEIDRTVLDITL